MYRKLPNLVLGFHGCNRNTFENVLYGVLLPAIFA